ncbi:MAG: DUF2961 domain-containing protein [Sandaracinaceae bacterium]|nr:DUF2961 domain-containing protein [Sandaracinaceae bacterium]
MAPRLLALLILAGCSAAPSDADAGPDAGRDAGPDAGAPDARPLVVVPEETADEQALRELLEVERAPTFAASRLAQQTSEERPGAGPETNPLLANGNRDTNHFVCLGEGSRVREGLVPNRYDLPACPEPYVRGAVLARFEGSGSLLRLWMTLLSIGTRPPPRERLRIYVDDDPEPRIDVPLAAALDGSASPIFAPPFGLARGDRLAWAYPVVFGSRLILALDNIGADLVYHQSVARLDPAPRPRAPLAAESPLRAELVRSLTARPAPARTPISLAALERREALALDGPATITALSVRAASLDALREVRVLARWDDAIENAIDIAALELFAAALDVPEPGPVLDASTADGGVTLTLRVPMPFATRAAIELESTGAATSLELGAEISPSVPPSRFGRLHVVRSQTLGPTLEPAHALLDLGGPGRLAGVCLMLEGHGLADPTFGNPLNVLEGDERFEVDGASLRGTGTEDYLDGAFYFGTGPFASPFAQAFGVRHDGTRGRATGCRWHLRSHAIDFAASLRGELEIGPGHPGLCDRYRSVAFVYR